MLPPPDPESLNIDQFGGWFGGESGAVVFLKGPGLTFHNCGGVGLRLYRPVDSPPSRALNRPSSPLLNRDLL